MLNCSLLYSVACFNMHAPVYSVGIGRWWIFRPTVLLQCVHALHVDVEKGHALYMHRRKGCGGSTGNKVVITSHTVAF
jgi:hypothetical protein